MSRIILSYTTINNYHKSPHSFLNKQLGIKTITSPAMSAGKEAHKLIQDHCLGVKTDPRLKALTWHFKTAERHVIRPYTGNYSLHGFLDLVAYNSKTLGEIKTGTIWGPSRFWELMQWRYYAMIAEMKHALLITCHFDLSGLKTFYFEATPLEIDKAKRWVDEAIAGIDAGKFTDDLVDGKCIRYDCPYGEACHFKI